MSTHLYCVLPGETPASVPSGLTGVEGGSVRALPVDHLVAWVHEAGSRAVERDFTGVADDGVGLEAGAIVDVDDRHLLPLKDVSQVPPPLIVVI